MGDGLFGYVEPLGLKEKRNKAIAELVNYCWHSVINVQIFPKSASNDRNTCPVLFMQKINGFIL